MSIIKVAKQAGVSPATVSRVVNNLGGVSTENIARVQQVMQELKYQPRKNKSSAISYPTVALLVVSTHELFHHTSTSSQTLEGIRSELSKHGINLVIANATTPEELPPIVARRQVNGLILQGQYPHPGVLERIKGIPAVWLTSHQDPSGDALLPGNEQIGKLAAEYLIGKGCRRLGALNAIAQSSALSNRIEFFCYTAEQAGLPAVQRFINNKAAAQDAEFVPALEQLERDVREQVRALVSSGERPDGLFVPLDLQTALVHRQLLRRGIQPGRDIRLIGSDDIRAAFMGLWPRPATIGLRSFVVGQLAVQQLLRRIADPLGSDGYVQVSIQPNLIPGEEWEEGAPL